MILVVGATGSLGGKITRGLIERGEAVRVLARPTSAYLPLEGAGANVVLGDLKDRRSLERSCQDVSAVITTASVSKTGDDSVGDFARSRVFESASSR